MDIRVVSQGTRSHNSDIGILGQWILESFAGKAIIPISFSKTNI